MSTVVFSIFGRTLDAPSGDGRWDRWRPTLDLCRQPDLLVDRLELLVDTPPARARTFLDDLEHLAPETDVHVHPISWDDPWDFEEVYARLHELATVYPFDEDDDYLIHITTGTHVAQICFFLLTESRHFPARLVQTAPPKRDRNQPGKFTIIDLDLSRYDKLASRFAAERADDVSVLKSGIDTRNAAFNTLIDDVESVASRSPAPLLLMGPTGAGKSHLARQVYRVKRSRQRVAGPFVEVNCATLRGDGAMSTLFGHTRGSFTGATSARAGLLREADGGVLFLDEVGELGLDEQAMLLRAIEDGVFRPVGSDRDVSSDFQLICGTNRDLRQSVDDGRFRDDLLARISLWTFRLPGLAERREDIPPNLEFELRRWTERTGDRVSMNADARDTYLRFAMAPSAPWRHNFRDFGASVERMATLCRGGRIRVADVESEIRRLRASWGQNTVSPSFPRSFRVLGDRIGDMDRFDLVQLEDVLEVVERSDTLSDAGRELFAESRKRRAKVNDADRLKKYLARLGLTFDEVHEALASGRPRA